MKWIEAKMQELGTLRNPNYKIAMLVDDGAMITVQDAEGHVVRWEETEIEWMMVTTHLSGQCSDHSFRENGSGCSDSYSLSTQSVEDLGEGPRYIW